MDDRHTPRHPADDEAPFRPLYFFPDDPIDETALRTILAEGSPERRAWAVSHLVRYADWEDIWRYIDRDELRTLLPDLDLPPRLLHAWARMLGVTATPV